jgi:hypothetical protein
MYIESPYAPFSKTTAPAAIGTSVKSAARSARIPSGISAKRDTDFKKETFSAADMASPLFLEPAC